MSPRPELSVIVPIEDTRGQEEAAVRSLVSEQTLDRDRYEVIVPMPGLDPDAESRVRGMLDPERDRAIPSENLGRYALMNLGAEQARAERLFFTEAHCVVDAECLEELLDFLAGNRFVGASCASHSKSDSAVGRYEDELFGQSLEWLPQPDHWYKTLIHGFAVDRDVFDTIGGFQHQFGNFSDIALSAAFDQGGYSLGYAPEAKVRHFYEGELRGSFDYIHDELRGEMEFRATFPAQYATRYAPDAYEWKDRGTDRVTARRLRRDARRAARRPGTPLRLRLTLLRAAASGNGRHALGGRLRAGVARLKLGARWAAMAARLRVRRPSYPAYVRWWEAATRYIRLHHVSGDGFPPSPWCATDGPLDLGSPEDRPLSGFGLVEEFEGRPLRWSGRAAAVELELDSGPHRVTLGVVPVRDPRDAPTTAVFDGQVLPDSAIHLHSDRVEIEIDAGSVNGSRGSRSLSIFTVPGRSYRLRHRRALGLPVHTVSVEPA